MLHRWWIYQRERFPLAAHGPLVAVFSLAVIGYSALLRGRPALPAWQILAAAFASNLIFFLQLRIADEFKDDEDDRRSRPYRPVPRGLVTLRELAAVALIGALVQLMLALCLAPNLLPLLIATWGYMLLMRVEFFAGHWLKQRPLLYLMLHMPILPLIALYASAWEWLAAGSTPPADLGWLLALSFLSGIVLEIGRKIRAPGDEEPGVETYSALWGRRKATGAWLVPLALAAASAVAAAQQVGSAAPVALIVAALFGAAAVVARRFLAVPATATARRIEQLSGVWVLAAYLSVGVLPLLLA
ncbi:MAG: hypothetical protein KatS3mg057_0586 [Herpetosiphonaceae bacterium]|nr:MAG: hypothetical protein KatS3mg057_0586 [Herpetosiphonaceae bacterium]